MVQYLTITVDTASLGMRNSRELQTLAQALHALLRNDLLLVGNTLVQRFKSVELAGSAGSWSLAQHLELTPATGASSAGQGEVQAATRKETFAHRLDRDGKGGGRRSGSEGSGRLRG